LDAVAYAFLLGMYLGDGSIARHPRAYKLRVVQDARYPNSIEEIRRAMATVRHCELDRIRTVQHVGCVEVYRVGKGKYANPRYLFSNRSEDIRRIFREACGSVGVRATNPKPDEISIARRADVVALDSFVGPKT
jgi:hypothetical protein